MENKHWNWKGGKTLLSSGYIGIRVGDENHLRMKNGYAYEHQLVAEKKLGRKLKKGEIVHHLNGNKTDNSFENIEILNSRFSHKVKHRKIGLSRQLPDQNNYLIFCECGCGEKFKIFDKYGRPRKYLPGHSRKGKLLYNPNETITCGCGCNISFKKYDNHGRERNFILGHSIFISNQYGKWLKRNKHMCSKVIKKTNLARLKR